MENLDATGLSFFANSEHNNLDWPQAAIVSYVEKLAVLHLLWEPINVTLLRDTGRERVRRGKPSG